MNKVRIIQDVVIALFLLFSIFAIVYGLSIESLTGAAVMKFKDIPQSVFVMICFLAFIGLVIMVNLIHQHKSLNKNLRKK